jgi:hypothetical protein
MFYPTGVIAVDLKGDGAQGIMRRGGPQTGKNDIRIMAAIFGLLFGFFRGFGKTMTSSGNDAQSRYRFDDKSNRF